MQIPKVELLNDLAARTRAALQTAEEFRPLRLGQLSYKVASNEWSALECLEHLNLYGDFYVPEIERRLKSVSQQGPDEIFKSGWIGNYFARLMQGKNGNIRKLKSPKDKNPINSVLNLATIDRFTGQLQQILQLLEKAKTADLTHTKVSLSITPYIKLRLGDTFRFVIFHIERHLRQAQRAIDKYQVPAL